jgi:heptosyltransferase-2
MVIAQSLYMVLKQSFPELQLHVLTMPWSEAILHRMPEVDQAHSLPIGHGELALKKRVRMARKLRQEKI